MHAHPAVALTGATGFLGRRLRDRLSSRGHQVIAIGREAAPEIPDGAAVVHLAALMPTRANAHDVDAHVANTVQTASRLVARIERASSVVLASSIDVYGPLGALPADEAHPTEPDTVYGACKLASEHLFRMACRRAGIPLTTLRLSQVYGPGEPPVKAIPRFIAALQHGASITVANGGRDTRDFIYLDDAVAAIEAAIDRRAEGVFNIAGGREVAILQVATTLARLHGAPEAVRVEPYAGSASRGWFDISAARRHLGYQPSVSIADGLARHYAAAHRPVSGPVHA